MLQELIVFFGLLFGSITDLKKREVLDSLSYSLIVIGLLMGVTLSIIRADWVFVINSFSGLLFGFLIGALFYYSGQWGGGDAKLVMGIGSVLGVNVFSMFDSLPVFFLFLITSLLFGAVYGLGWIVFLAIKNRKEFLKEYAFINNRKNSKIIKIVLIFLTIVVLSLFLFVNINTFFVLVAYVLTLLIVFSFYMANMLKAVELSAMRKQISVDLVVEGDWVLDEFNFKNNKLVIGKTGISAEDIALLKKENVKFVTVKEGIPFVPSFFMGYLIILFFGNWLFYFL